MWRKRNVSGNLDGCKGEGSDDLANFLLYQIHIKMAPPTRVPRPVEQREFELMTLILE